MGTAGGDVLQRIGHWDGFSNPEDLAPEQLANPNGWFWARVFLWETRSFCQRIRFAAKILRTKTWSIGFSVSVVRTGGRSLLLYERKSLHASHKRITLGLPLDRLGRHSRTRSNVEVQRSIRLAAAWTAPEL